MRDLNGNNNGVIIDQSITVNKNDSNEYDKTPIEKEEVSIKKIFKEKMIEAIIGVIFGVVSAVLGSFVSSGQSSTLQESSIYLVIIGIFIVCVIATFILVFCFVIDLLHILQLRKKGKFVEFQSKTDLISRALSTNNVEENRLIIRRTGKIYKNIDGKIFLIKSKKCPICETEPIGNMRLVYDCAVGEYVWLCSEQPSHKVEFDYKKKF